MSDMWKHRAPPTPLEYDKIADGSFSVPPVPYAIAANGFSKSEHASASTLNPVKKEPNGASKAASGLKDQKELTLQESLILFVSR